MLSGLILENFKAFGIRQFIPLAPITLIFGANSAGKSSIMQALLLLKQTLSQADTAHTLLLPKGDLVDLGSFRELVFHHDESLTCEITPLLARREASDIYFPNPQFRQRFRQADLVGVGPRFRVDRSDRTIQLAGLPYYWGDHEKPAFTLRRSDTPREVRRRFTRTGSLRQRSVTGSYTNFASIDSIEPTHAMWQEAFSAFSPRLRDEYVHYLESMLGELRDAEQNPGGRLVERLMLLSEEDDEDGGPIEALSHMIREFENQIARLQDYSLEMFQEDVLRLGQDRIIALRQFLPDEAAMTGRTSVTFDRMLLRLGEPNALRYREPILDISRFSVSVASSVRSVFERLIYLGPLRDFPERHYIFSGNEAQEVGKSGRQLPDLLFRRPDLVKRTNDVLKTFDVGYTLRVHRVSDPDVEDVFGLRLVDESSGTTVSMMDVGFGISQVLPIVVQSTLSSDNVVLIEQPEIHLHPRLQADLGSLFATCISSPQENQFVIETHSEHLILRLQRLIRERSLNPADVSVIYVMKSESGSQCYPLRLDDDGDFIDEWPEGFFEEDFEEMFA